MDLNKTFDFYDVQKAKFIDHLSQWVSVKSVSASTELRHECFRMVDTVVAELVRLNCKVNVVNNPAKHQKLACGKTVKLPPIIFASYGNDSTKKTVCIYGHIDVQPADKSDGWDSEPFQMVVKDDLMIGRGTSDDKGPVLGWICLLKACEELKMRPNVNLKFIFECMEESGSEGLPELLVQQKHEFLKVVSVYYQDVDFVCVTDNTWIGQEKPCLTYGLRGVVSFFLEVHGPAKDLHSGVFGGSVKEPMTDLILLLSHLVDVHGKIMVPKIMDHVSEFTEQEKKHYADIQFDPDNYAKGIGCESTQLTSASKIDVLSQRWRFPSLSIHGIEGAFSEPGFKTVVGKFSIRIVPDMTIKETEEAVREYILKLVKELEIKNKVRNSGSPWMSDVGHPNYRAAITAIKHVFGVEPDLTREGGSIPVTLMLQETTGKNVVLIPMGRGDDGAHSQNEKLNISNFMNGIKVFTAYIHELGKL